MSDEKKPSCLLMSDPTLCPLLHVFLTKEWPEYRGKGTIAMNKIDEMHTAVGSIHQDTKHLRLLDNIAGTLSKLESGIIDALVGKDVISTQVAKDMLIAQQTNYTSTIGTICKVFGAIILIVVGIRLLAPHWFGS